MSNRTFSIPVSAAVKTRNGLYKVTHTGDQIVSFDPETMTIESIMYGGVNILPVLTQNDPSLEQYYMALESFEDDMRTSRAVDEENNYHDLQNN